MIRTKSPFLNAFSASCARYFLVLRTVFFRTGCVKRRSTETVMDWSLAALVTVPCRILLGIAFAPLLVAGRRGGLFVEDRLDTRRVTAGDLHAGGVFQLPGGRLKAQVELLFLQARQLLAELIRGLVT